ncbi:right-handed parallel beta-helix repeat-containing protein [Winogradskyella psychrotolerans]|uniref:right-handed parallel beta-helix repeat-containing protein n=1 Tax=Winogradskyella psychrotolerans TaxID=1344585 RepID=UPI001C06E896|nr:right-handed parallel beta-helix repeat-containing protein [Winogradskyella psychrotolerans]MBU2929885.1 right-handed parallel beta-helix repeat-containing protein [Winogradskyella psychrotolerans]
MRTNNIRLKYYGVLLLFSWIAFSACDSNNTKKNEEHIELYVSVEGNDKAVGTLSEPFATIPKAVEAVRELRKNGNAAPATIYLRDGRHLLSETLVLGIEDGWTTSGETSVSEATDATKFPLAHLTFSAYQEETPIISSGVPVEKWELASDELLDIPEKSKGKVWVANIPEGLTKFYTLYDEEGRLNRARAEGFVPTKMGDKKTVHFPEGKLKNWDNLEDVELNIRPSRAWMINMLPLASVDEVNRVAKTKVSATYAMGELAHWVHTKDGNSAWIENTLEALDEPGEWVINSKTRKIYLWPKHPAADGSPQGILAPTTSELVRVEGAIDYDGAKDQAVKGISFSGITFSHADRRAWTNDEQQLGWGMQHDWDMFDSPTAMLRFRGAENCQVTKCKFVNSGGSGVRFDLHAQRNKVEDSEFAHLGEAGIILAGYGPGTKDVNHHNEIINNEIHHFSEITWHSPGIWAWQSGHNRIANNYIHHSGYAGILITNRVEPDRKLNGEGGRTVRRNEIPQDVIADTEETYENWKVREKYNHSRHNIVEYNEITHAVQLLSDGNCIYVSGAGTGNIIRYNYLHDNLEHSMPAPIRCDDDQHETLIQGNVLYNNYAFAAGIASKGTNDIINNFIIAPRVAPKLGYISFEWVPVTGSKVHRNIIVSHPDGGNAYAERPRKDQTTNLPNLMQTEMDSNLYYHPTNPNFMEAHFKRMRAAGKEESSRFAEPMFIDVAGENFGFKEGSPALELGIEPLDVSKMGLIK